MLRDRIMNSPPGSEVNDEIDESNGNNLNPINSMEIDVEN